MALNTVWNVLVAIVVCVPVAWGGELAEPRVWLDKMSHSQRELSYEGAFTYEQSGSMKSMKITHAIIDGEEFERLEHLDGEERELIRRGHGPECIHFGDGLLRLYQQQSRLKNTVDHFYDFSVVGRDRVAGRRAVELAIMPRDKHRFGHRLSVDESTGLLLRSIRYGANNQVLERFQFVELTVGGVFPESHFIGHGSSHYLNHIAPSQSKVSREQRQWKLSWLPGGFSYTPNTKPVTHVQVMAFTDGLAAFSVFLEPNDLVNGQDGVQGWAQRGATMAYSRVMLLGGSPFRVTVVGEIPQKTAERIASSVVFTP